LRSEQTTTYVYEKANLTSAYANGVGASGLNFYHRNYVNLGGTTIVLFDRIQAKSASYPKGLRFHLNNLSTNTNLDGVIRSTVGSSTVFIKPISPPSTLTLDTSDVVTTMPRVRILPPGSVINWNPLTVIETGSSTATMASTERVVSSVGTMIGVYINDPNNPNVVLFSNDLNGNDVTGNITYTLSTPAGKSPWHTIVHLPSNTDYTVVRPLNSVVAQTYQLIMGKDYTRGVVYRTSSQGVLRFEPGLIVTTYPEQPYVPLLLLN
jgi:hypothetical protein